jgi:peroxiredoxin
MGFKLLWLVTLIVIVHCDVLIGQKRIVIDAEVSGCNVLDSVEVRFSSLDYIGNVPKWDMQKFKVENGRVKVSMCFDSPVVVVSSLFSNEQRPYIVEPGDSIFVSSRDGSISYSGVGYHKLKLQDEIEIEKKKILLPGNPKPHRTNSVEDYMEFHAFLNDQVRAVEQAVELYKSDISEWALMKIKANAIAKIEEERLFKFWMLKVESKKIGVSGCELSRIWDTTLYSRPAQWMRSLSNGVVDRTEYFYCFNRSEVYRAYGFDDDSLRSESRRRLLYYRLAKKRYSGMTRERLIVLILTEKTMKDVGFHPSETDEMLSDYYTSYEFPRFKEWVREYERNYRKLFIGDSIANFSFKDERGRYLTLKDFAGKVVLLNFWKGDSEGRHQIASFLRAAQEEFRGDTNIVFIHVSLNKDGFFWKDASLERRLVNGKGTNLYVIGCDVNKTIENEVGLSPIPVVYLLSPYGRIVDIPFADSRSSDKDRLIGRIKEQVVVQHDGPYVLFRSNNSMVIYTINNARISTLATGNLKGHVLKVQTDLPGKYFELLLKSKLTKEPSEYFNVDKLFVVSDIEGNFSALRRLLQVSGVIDDNYNWTFGKGHVVVNGDVFDRGQQVTECLWLIYSLEEKAKAAGGYVHFILGNHEIMNLKGDFRYVQEKYRSNVKRMGISYAQLWGLESELGRWLRTKNVIEKINDILFVHGGIASEVNQMPISIDEINSLVRESYREEGNLEIRKNIGKLFDKRISPFWYRNYYEDDGDPKKARGCQVDSTLKKFAVRRIITGHTITDSISVHYEGKVINVDTYHAKGRSEAVLILGGDCYRVKNNGDRVLLAGRRQKFYSSNID